MVTNVPRYIIKKKTILKISNKTYQSNRKQNKEMENIYAMWGNGTENGLSKVLSTDGQVVCSLQSFIYQRMWVRFRERKDEMNIFTSFIKHSFSSLHNRNQT